MSNTECDLTRSAGARYRDSNSDYVNTNQQHYVLYGERNTSSSIDVPQISNEGNYFETFLFLSVLPLYVLFCCSMYKYIMRLCLELRAKEREGKKKAKSDYFDKKINTFIE